MPRLTVGIAATAVISIFLLIMWLTVVTARKIAFKNIQTQSELSLKLIEESLRGELSKYLYHPQLLASNSGIAKILSGEPAEEKIRSVNEKLEHINRISGALAIHVMNDRGEVVASSKWNEHRNFIGKNFSHFPYFQAAMQGRLGRHFAAESTSGRRSYYFAYPVRSDNQIIGVVVTKMALNRVENSWITPDQEVLVVDDNEVIFLSSNPHWRLRSFRHLNETTHRRPGKNFENSNPEFRPLVISEITDEPLITIDLSFSTTAAFPQQYIMTRSKMEDAGWTVMILASTASVSRQVNIALIIATTLMLSLILGITNFCQRRWRLKERLAFQNEARITLEARVRNRTRKLMSSNRKLMFEIAERERAEAELRRTQSELVRAEKLAALGQMSAGLSHELNQPLAAIRFYADNTQKFLDNNDIPQTRSNLQSISELTDRMAKIVKHLRTYASTQPAETGPVSPLVCLDEALTLLRYGIQRHKVSVEIKSDTSNNLVMGGDVQLQQVFINLLNNSIEALLDSPKKVIKISIHRKDDMIEITFEDSGTGISAKHLERIFDPFFTTKEKGVGLGLGLSISSSIVKQIGGSIRAGQSEIGGAKFVIVLKPAVQGEGLAE